MNLSPFPGARHQQAVHLTTVGHLGRQALPSSCLAKASQPALVLTTEAASAEVNEGEQTQLYIAKEAATRPRFLPFGNIYFA